MKEIEKLYFIQLDIGHFFYDVQLGVYGVKVSARSYFDLNNNALRRLNNHTATSRKVYYICDYEVW